MVTGGDGGECESGAARGARGPEPAAPPRRQPQRPLTLPAGRPAWLDYLRQRHPGVFGSVYVAGLALRPVPGQPRPGTRGATPLFGFLYQCEQAQIEMVFGLQLGARLKTNYHQLPNSDCVWHGAVSARPKARKKNANRSQQ